MDDFKVPVCAPSSTTKNDDSEQTPIVENVTSNKENPVQNCPYKVPSWSASVPEQVNYKLEVLKSGQIIDEVNDLETKAYWKIGRLNNNDIELAHPTISRFHAILQYKPENVKENNEESGEDVQPSKGWYIYDLGSTHGTFLNKQRVPSKVYVRVRVGHMLRLGASTRNFILQGPSEDEEPESEFTVTELITQREEKVAAEAQRQEEKFNQQEKDDGISWGMAEDADEETDLSINPYASTNNEEIYIEDPKRTLRGYFEREDLPLEYKCDEMSTGVFVCRVELPIYDSLGKTIVAEVIHKGKKKDCVAQCALESCRILDRHGVLRQANQEPQKKKAMLQSSDSDNDEFLDRTGDIARKKLRKANPINQLTVNYDDLVKQDIDIRQQLDQVEVKINDYQDNQKRLKRLKADQDQNSDDLDSFMKTLNEDESKIDKNEIRKLRLDKIRLNTEYQKVQHLKEIAKPLNIPFSKNTNESENKPVELNTSTLKCSKKLPIIGKRNQFTKFKIVKEPPSKVAKTKLLPSDEEEEEDDTSDMSNKDNEDIIQSAKYKSSPEKLIAEEAMEVEENVPNEESEEIIDELLPTDNLLDEQKLQKDPRTVDNEQMDKTVVSNTEGDHKQIGSLSESNTDEQAECSLKKRRVRPRQRVKRQDVEDPKDYETSEKYSKWIPPKNQSGDGFTKLNEKYGY